MPHVDPEICANITEPERLQDGAVNLINTAAKSPTAKSKAGHVDGGET